jgi:S1-C subfamily serine protease
MTFAGVGQALKVSFSRTEEVKMKRNLRFSLLGMMTLAPGLCGAFLPSPAHAQSPERVAKEDAVLVVDGVVRQVFRSPRQTRTDYLVQIEVQRSEARRAPKTTSRPYFPAPGDSIYVHVFQRADVAGLIGGTDTQSTVPTERAQVRVYLIPREPGVWEGTFPDWFELTSDKPAAATKADPAPSVAESPRSRAALVSLGMTTEALKVKDRLVLRVKSVEQNGLAQQAGIEVGDVIVGAKGEALKNEEQLEDLARQGESVPLIVMDGRTGRAAQVVLRPAQRPGEPKAAEPKPEPAERRSLGLAAEPVKVGERTALKVTRVEQGSPANKAGIEPGDILVAVNGVPITGPEQLSNAFRKSGPVLNVTVRDSRTGRDVPIEVAVGGPKLENSLPTEVPGVGPGKGRLGAVTELAFYDVEAAVKVTEVEPGSPAARAGLQPGILILEADGKPVLHPNQLNDAVRASTGTLKLTIVEPRTGKKGTVEVNLGAGK